MSAAALPATLRTSRSRFTRYQMLTIAAILASGAMLSLAGFLLTRADEDARTRSAFERRATEAINSLEASIDSTLNSLEPLVSFHDAAGTFSRSSFHRFVAPLLARDPRIQALEWSPRVLSSQRETMEQMAQRDGLSGFRFTEQAALGRMRTEGPRDEYYPVYYVEPLAGNEAAIGFDLASSKPRKAAIEAAIASGQMVATRRITLVQETGNQYGFLVFKPVYASAAPLHTRIERRDAILGVMLGVFRVGDIVAHSLESARGHEQLFNLVLYDESAPPTERLLFPKGYEPGSIAPEVSKLRVSREFDVGGRKWQVIAFPTKEFMLSTRQYGCWLILGAGLLISGLLSAIADVLFAKRNRVGEQKRLLDVAVENICQGLVMFDRENRVVVINPRYIEMYGLSRDRAIPGCSPRDLLKWRTEAGTFGGDIDEYIGRLDEQLHGVSRTTQIPDGRTVLVTSRRTADGGWVSTHEDVTERTQAQQALETTLATMDQGLMMIDSAGRIAVCNRRAMDLLKLPPALVESHPLLADMLRYQWESNGVKQFWNDFDSFVRARLVLDRPQCFEVTRASGQILECRNVPLPGGGAVRTYTDITERKRAEIALSIAESKAREAHQRLLDAFEVVPEGLVLFDSEDRYVLWNRRYAELYAKTEVKVGMRFEDNLHAGIAAGEFPDAVGRESEWLSERLSLHAGAKSSHEQRQVDDRWLRIEERRTSDGGSIGVRVDITDLKRREASFRLLFEGNPVPMWVMEQSTLSLVDVNAAAIRHYGYTRDEFLAMTLLDIGHAEDREKMRTAAGSPEAQFSSGKTWRHLRANGSVVEVGLFSEHLNYQGRPATLVAIIDVTQQRHVERQLQQAQKMEAVGQLTGGIAHDFNNILTVITGTIEILAKSVAGEPSLATIARMIDEAATRGAELTQRLLAFARRQPLQPRTVDVNALMVDAAKLLRPTLGEHIAIESAFANDAWPAMVDPSQLTTALLNLALNARDAMPEGGKLVIETGNVHLDESYARAQSEVTPGPYVMIAVSDTGHGIPASIRDRVFDPFFTTKGPGKGTGLGLSMVYGFVKQSNGHIKIYSEEGHGTTIKIYLPRTRGQADKAGAAQSAIAIQGGTETILVVEDDPLVCNYVASQLNSLGYTTLTAANATEALALIDGGTDFDLLFTDVIMPGPINGRKLADAAMRRRPSLKVLFTSGYTDNAIVHHGRLDPGVLLLAKPYRKADLARMVRIALTRSPDIEAGVIAAE